MSQLILAIEHLDGEGLVQLPEADVIDLESEPLEQARHGEDRADAHLVGPGASDRHADIAAQWVQPALLRHTRFHHHTR